MVVRESSTSYERVLIARGETFMTSSLAIARAFGSIVSSALLLVLISGCGRRAATPGTTPLSEPASSSAATPVTTPLSELASSSDTSGLNGTRWRLMAFENGATATPVLTGTQVTAVFEGELLGGRSGCNWYETPAIVSGQNLKLLEVFQTAVGCDNSVMQQEDRYLAALRSAQSFQFQVVGDSLTIAYDGGVLRFTRMPPLPDCGPDGGHPIAIRLMVLQDCKPKKGTVTTPTPGFKPTPPTSP
jgi:heat shock protein HslJ